MLLVWHCASVRTAWAETIIGDLHLLCDHIMTMTTETKTNLETFTGIAKRYPNGWWAMCDQLPVAFHGSSYTDALKGIVGSIHTFRTYSNGCGLPKMQDIPREGEYHHFEMKLPIG